MNFVFLVEKILKFSKRTNKLFRKQRFYIFYFQKKKLTNVKNE